MTSTTIKLTFTDFFQSYIFSRPEAYMHYLSERDQKIVNVAKKILFVITLGTLPYLCKRVWGNIQNCKAQVKELALRRNYFYLPQFVEDADLIDQSQDKDCDRILNGLFLGSTKGLAEATTLKFHASVKSPLTKFNNKYEFESVITLCPLRSIQGDCYDLELKELAEHFSNRKVTWLRLGNYLFDHQDAGFDLAYNATILEPEVIVEVPVGLSEEELIKLSQQKREAIEKLHVTQWFEPVFAEMDKAVLGHGNVLVHCQAGVSRSASLVAAYLINRFNLPVETAINYLKHKRACVNPKFTAFLNEYARRIRS